MRSFILGIYAFTIATALVSCQQWRAEDIAGLDDSAVKLGPYAQGGTCAVVYVSNDIDVYKQNSRLKTSIKADLTAPVFSAAGLRATYEKGDLVISDRQHQPITLSFSTAPNAAPAQDTDYFNFIFKKLSVIAYGYDTQSDYIYRSEEARAVTVGGSSDITCNGIYVVSFTATQAGSATTSQSATLAVSASSEGHVFQSRKNFEAAVRALQHPFRSHPLETLRIGDKLINRQAITEADMEITSDVTGIELGAVKLLARSWNRSLKGVTGAGL